MGLNIKFAWNDCVIVEEREGDDVLLIAVKDTTSKRVFEVTV
jgi:hypothetical protein